jgi:hypothetical protein
MVDVRVCAVHVQCRMCFSDPGLYLSKHDNRDAWYEKPFSQHCLFGAELVSHCRAGTCARMFCQI